METVRIDEGLTQINGGSFIAFSRFVLVVIFVLMSSSSVDMPTQLARSDGIHPHPQIVYR